MTSCKRWGGHYDYMIVLDADSLMSADDVDRAGPPHAGRSAARLAADRAGLIGQRSLFARMQQFASRVYGGVIARGVAAWSGDDGNYWGHNAIIRVRAFAANLRTAAAARGASLSVATCCRTISSKRR